MNDPYAGACCMFVTHSVVHEAHNGGRQCMEQSAAEGKLCKLCGRRSADYKWNNQILRTAIERLLMKCENDGVWIKVWNV